MFTEREKTRIALVEYLVHPEQAPFVKFERVILDDRPTIALSYTPEGGAAYPMMFMYADGMVVTDAEGNLYKSPPNPEARA